MLFKPADVCTLIGFDAQKLVYWRRTLVPLEDKKGNARNYDHHDVVALLVFIELTEKLRAAIGTVQPMDRKIFECCRRVHWKQLAHYTLLLFPNRGDADLQRTDSLNVPLDAGLCVLIQLADPVNYLSALLHDEEQKPSQGVPMMKARQRRSTSRSRAQARRA